MFPDPLKFACENEQGFPADYSHTSALDTAVSFIEVRCLVNEIAATQEHEHAGVELILNLGDLVSSVVWRNSSGEAKTAKIDANYCCLIPAGVRHYINGLRPYGLVSLLVANVAQADCLRHDATEVLVESIKKLPLMMP